MEIDEDIIYYLFKFKKECKDQNAKIIIDSFNSEFKKNNGKNVAGKNYNDLILFLDFLKNIKKKDNNNTYMILEQFYFEEKFNIYYLFALIIGYNSGLNVDEFLNINDQLIKKIFLSYKLYCQHKFRSSYKVIVSISYIHKYKLIIDLILLQNMIELNLLDEALNLGKELFKRNKNNILFNLIISTIYLKKENYSMALKLYSKFKKKLLTSRLRENYLYVCLKLKDTKFWIRDITKYKKLEEDDYFLIAKYYHKNGFLDLAYDYYQKLDPVTFPVNKMIGIIYYQMGRFNESIKYLKEEIKIRGEDPDVLKILKYLQLKALLKK